MLIFFYFYKKRMFSISGKSKAKGAVAGRSGTATPTLSSAESVASAPGQQNMGSVPAPEPGFPDPYKLLADARRVTISKELSGTAKMLNCMFGLCGVTRYRYYVRDAVTGRDLFKAKLSYAAACNVCSGGVRHNYTLDLYSLPLDGSKVLKDQARKGMFLSTSSSAKSTIASGGHGVMDLRNTETVGRLIPSAAGAITVKDGSGATALRLAVPVKVGHGSAASEMLIEDGATTALVGRLVKQWSRGDNDWSLLCCCASGTESGPFTLDMSAVSNVKKRALLVMAGIIADAVAFDFRAAGPAVSASGEKASLISATSESN